MPRPAGQSDFTVRREEPADVAEEKAIANGAGATSTKWVLRITVIVLALLLLLLMIGPHIPSGE